MQRTKLVDLFLVFTANLHILAARRGLLLLCELPEPLAITGYE